MRPERRSPPVGAGEISPVAPKRVTQRTALAMLTPKRLAAALRDSPPKTTASTTRLRRSSESAIPAASFPRRQPKSELKRFGNPPVDSVRSDTALTPHNPHLSRPTNGASEAPQEVILDASGRPSGMLFSAIDCNYTLRAEVETYVQAGIAPATKRAYRADLDHFQAWGGQLPASDGLLAAYLAAHAETLSVATLVRRLASISVAHETHGLPNPGPVAADPRRDAGHPPRAR